MASKDIVFWDITPCSLLPNEDGGRILGEVHGVKYRKSIIFRVTAVRTSNLEDGPILWYNITRT